MTKYLRLTYWYCILTNRIALRNQRGASAVEYAVLVAAVAALLVASVMFWSWMLNNLYLGMCTTAQNGTPCS